MTSDAPAPYAQAIYGATLRSVRYGAPVIARMANTPNLVGHLDHHSPTRDGSFWICAANGEGVSASKVESKHAVAIERGLAYISCQAPIGFIPAEHLPQLDTSYKPDVKVVGGMVFSIGATFIPFFLMKRDTGEKIRVVLHVIVLSDLFMTMFIGVLGGQIIRTMVWDRNRPVFGFSFGQEDDGLTSARSILEWGQEVDGAGSSGIARDSMPAVRYAEKFI
ncbi:hypothetical protein CPB84DRAFT_1749384 [Gymnopilus junonius]|uniref:Uncharacterized protein n=1 Tax=Gymnopilus junonius TaxID=109634 RepID=A0A9P5NIW6_GYMJU|nr:hypothetical protein CPB84DRAFT_1749384 [Gymnopilus junonius]